jgi:glutamyl-tRNA reductase
MIVKAAYWISPKGEIIQVTGTSGTTHIDTVINNPDVFGVTIDEMKEVYEKYGEPFRTEGKAREEIIRNIVKKGWIRVRKYKNSHWSFNVHRLSKKVKDHIFDWADKITEKGLFNQNEDEIHLDVKILSVLDDSMETTTIKEILEGSLYESVEKMDSDNVLVEKMLKHKNMVSWTDLI